MEASWESELERGEVVVAGLCGRGGSRRLVIRVGRAGFRIDGAVNAHLVQNGLPG